MIKNNIFNEKITEKKLKKICEELNVCIKALYEKNQIKEIKIIIKKINEHRNDFLTYYWVSYVGSILDYTDEKYINSEKLMIKYEPKINILILKYYKFLAETNFKENLMEEYGSRLFDLANNEVRLLNDDVEKLLTEENKIVSEYTKIILTHKVKFKNQELNYSGLTKYLISNDRQERKLAFNLRYQIIDDLHYILKNKYDELIKIRETIKKSLNLNFYTDYGYIKMNRIGYEKKDIHNFRKYLKEYILPLYNELAEKKQKRFSYSLEYYDDFILFEDGEAEFNCDLDQVLEITKDILKRENNELFKLFDYMIKNELIDLKPKDNKRRLGITTFFPKYKIPMFVQTMEMKAKDLTTLYHEFGHSSQLFLNKDKLIQENRWPTFDICEIHSTSMEALMYKNAYRFFDKDLEKFKLSFINNYISEIINCAFEEEFYEFIYDNPKATSNEREQKYKSLKQEYFKNKKSINDKEWYMSLNRIGQPFYLIDYALDRICSATFLKEGNMDFDKYIEMCKIGGETSLKELIKQMNLLSPFIEEDIKETGKILKRKITLWRQ